MQPFRFRWWHALGIFTAANLVNALPVGFGGDFEFYNSFRQPMVAPPDWLFPPMWFFLNVTSLIALHRIANRPDSSNRRVFLISEAAGWVLFGVFSMLYFLMQSPTFAAIDTVCGMLVAGVSIATAAKLDRVSAILIGFRLLWLVLASYVSVWIASQNPDPFFGKVFGP